MELDPWSPHSLVQAREDTLAWIAIDSDRRMGLDEALALHREKIEDAVLANTFSGPGYLY